MAGITAAQPNTEARVLTLFADGGFSVIILSEEEKKTPRAKPALVSKCPNEATPGIQVILFVVTAFAHEKCTEIPNPFRPVLSLLVY